MEPTAAVLLIAALAIAAAAVAILRSKRPLGAVDASSDMARLTVQLQEREREVEQIRDER